MLKRHLNTESRHEIGMPEQRRFSYQRFFLKPPFYFRVGMEAMVTAMIRWRSP